MIDLPFEGRKVKGSRKYSRRERVPKVRSRGEETITEPINSRIGEFHTIVCMYVYIHTYIYVCVCIVKQLNAVLSEIKGKKVYKPPNFIKFVREGEKPGKRKTEFRSGLLLSAHDWIVMHDSTSSPLICPQHIAQTSLRPDIIMYSNETRQIVLLELTIPAEDNIVQRHSDKEFKYAKLVDDIELNHWKGYIFAVEIGSRGYVAKSFGYAMRRLGALQRQVSKFTQELSRICLRSSYTIYLSRNKKVWRSWENNCFPKKKVQSKKAEFSLRRKANKQFCRFQH